MSLKTKLQSLILGSCMFSVPAFASILPPNDLHLQDTMELDSGVTQAQFNAVIDKAERYYRPIMARHGGELQITRSWNDSTVNASAIQLGDTWNVTMYGGLARRPEVTVDGFALVLCHEIGHHLAGFPYVSSWASNEGQSDYYGSLSCLRELWKNDTTENAAAARVVDSHAKAKCDSVWTTASDRNMCYRIMMAGRSLAELLGAGAKVSFKTPDTRTVSSTNHSHPAAQCRLDTYMAGALCRAKFAPGTIPDSETASASYTCANKSLYSEGLRPRCWYAPDQHD